MVVELNHTIVSARDKRASAMFLAEILGLPSPASFGPFLTVQVDNDVTLDFLDSDSEITPQHYAFLVGENNFDEIFGRIRERELPYWADPFQQQPVPRGFKIDRLGPPRRKLPGTAAAPQ